MKSLKESKGSQDVKNFIADYGPNASMIADASREEIKGWFEGNGLPVPDDIEEFRSDVIEAIRTKR